ncbi:MAG TPA: hypothetical protein VK099_07330 [Alcanivoracaceae bacterium]|nr:hypothetical protein [Alcanivoracaceae bacterium]
MVERELQRQKMLREMGFAAWVAQTPLPGAMTSPVLGEKPSAAPPSAAAPSPMAATATEQQPASPQGSPQELLAQVRAGLGSGRRREPAAPAAAAVEQTPAAQTPPVQRSPMRFTLQVLPMSFGYLMVQQKDPSAPSFNREEQRLLQGFAALWGGYHGMPRTFACPLGRQPMYENDAKEALTGYLSALSETWQAPQNKVLVLAQPRVAELMVAQRYMAQPLHDGQLLVVSSLVEMLHEPIVHKKASWQAIMEAGYYAAAQHS